MHPQSILAHLAPLLTNQVENFATDALAHLLLEYPVISDGFREYLSQSGVKFTDSIKIKTQASWQDGAIPDLVGQDQEGRYIIIVESKFWAPLTSNQPETYLKRLPFDRQAILIFIAPASRLRILWSELLARSNVAQPNKFNAQLKGQFLIAPINEKHILALTSWEAFLDFLHHKASEAGDTYATADIWQLQSLCTRIDEEVFKPLCEDEITSPSEKRIIQYKSLVDELVKCLLESGMVSVVGYRATPGPNYYKRYIHLAGLPDSDWCLEFNLDYGKKFHSTSIWLTALITPQISGLFSRIASESHKYGKQFLYPLVIPLEVEQDAIVSKLIEQVHDVRDRLLTE
jgi:hypothetical protein